MGKEMPRVTLLSYQHSPGSASAHLTLVFTRSSQLPPNPTMLGARSATRDTHKCTRSGRPLSSFVRGPLHLRRTAPLTLL